MIDIEKFICDVYKLASVRANHELCHAIDYAFRKQGLEYKDGKIVRLTPELEESEDERVRKELFKHLKEGADGYEPAGNSEDYKRWLGWFEKQGWSEWDEKIYNLLYEEYKNLAYYSHSREKAEDIPGEVLGWLKSLKNRVLPQPKQEWSEEDNRKMGRIYSILGQAADTHAYSTTCRLIGDKECIELQDFLKYVIDRVQPQPQWKPSDEQMEAFYTYLYHPQYIDNSDDYRIKLVISLYEQLKKLKE